MTKHQFDLAGGHPALDFVNTVSDWTVAQPHDHLERFEDAVRFGEASGLLTRSESARLRRSAGGAELVKLRLLRQRLHRVFQTRLTARAPDESDLSRLDENFVEAARATRLHTGAGARMMRQIALDKAGPAVLRLRIVEAAVALLLSDASAHVKSCPGCGWLFLDATKNHSRRWCRMSDCGARAKARRYYRRRKNLLT
jgi:predicted RNA-binding Zn ribbon-like protein